MVKRLLISAAVAIVVLGAVAGFAASLSVSSTSLGAGNTTVGSCNATASVGYTVSFVGGQYVVDTAPVTSNTTCANMSYSVTLTGAGGSTLATVTGTLGTGGSATPSLLADSVPAANVTGVSLAITG